MLGLGPLDQTKCQCCHGVDNKLLSLTGPQVSVNGATSVEDKVKVGKDIHAGDLLLPSPCWQAVTLHCTTVTFPCTLGWQLSNVIVTIVCVISFVLSPNLISNAVVFNKMSVLNG